MYTTNIFKQTHIGSFTHCSRRRKCAAVRCPPETGKIKNCTHCNSPIKCWLSSGPSPLRLSNWLWLACGWERARGSAGHPSRAFHMGADIAIILSDDSTIQLSELGVHDSVVSELSHRKQGWVSIMKPKKKNEGIWIREDYRKTSHNFRWLWCNNKNKLFLLKLTWRKWWREIPCLQRAFLLQPSPCFRDTKKPLMAPGNKFCIFYL